jgi:hypothetical protein
MNAPYSGSEIPSASVIAFLKSQIAIANTRSIASNRDP